MGRKRDRVAEVVESFEGQGADAHYLGYFDCFNRQLFFEAHEVLEVIWLEQRSGPNGAFFKGLIQLAGAFVHVQKQRWGPAAALLRLAQANLQGYPADYGQLEMARVRRLIEEWLQRLQEAKYPAALALERWPRLNLARTGAKL